MCHVVTRLPDLGFGDSHKLYYVTDKALKLGWRLFIQSCTDCVIFAEDMFYSRQKGGTFKLVYHLANTAKQIPA